MLPTADESPSPQQPSTAEQPLQIDRFRILEQLGAGGMGTVYKANDPELNRAVALKLPRFDGPPDVVRARMERFRREARAVAGVRHPNVCPVYDVGEHEGQPFVVMAYIEGESLAQRLSRERQYQDPQQAVALVRQVLDGLEAVHSHGIIHRDLKPSNILLDRDGHAILTDFGLARSSDHAEHFTTDGLVIGTPAYMAPEQAAGESQKVGVWTDVYGLGVVLYQMLTGRLPFEGPALAVLARIVHESPPLPSRVRPNLDPSLEAVVLKAMARDIPDRFQGARQFNDALAKWSPTVPPDAITEAPQLAQPKWIPPSSTQANTLLLNDRLVKKPRSYRATVLIGLVIFLVMTAAAGYYFLPIGHVPNDGTGGPILRTPNPSVTKANYLKIKPGMTRWEVEDILGPGEKIDAIGGAQTVEWRSLNKAIRATFYNHKMIDRCAKGLNED